MNIYCELFFDRIRIKINDEEIAFQVGPAFYENKMTKDSLLAKRINGYVLYHKSGLTFFERMKYRFSGNKVYILVNQDVQESASIRQIHDFVERSMDGHGIYIIPKPVTFDSTELEDVKKIRTEYIKGRRHGDTAMAQVRIAMSSGNARMARQR